MRHSIDRRQTVWEANQSISSQSHTQTPTLSHTDRGQGQASEGEGEGCFQASPSLSVSHYNDETSGSDDVSGGEKGRLGGRVMKSGYSCVDDCTDIDNNCTERLSSREEQQHSCTRSSSSSSSSSSASSASSVIAVSDSLRGHGQVTDTVCKTHSNSSSSNSNSGSSSNSGSGNG